MKQIWQAETSRSKYYCYKKEKYIVHEVIHGQIVNIWHFDTFKESIDYVFGILTRSKNPLIMYFKIKGGNNENCKT